MLLRIMRPLALTFLLLTVFTSSALATIASNWTNPDAHLPSFSSTYLVGERILLSWQFLNASANDLWLARYDPSTDDFALRIASGLDISKAGSFPWIISIAEEEVLKDTRFTFVFTEPGSNYDADADSDLESPSFNLKIVNQATPPNGTVTDTTSSAPSSTSNANSTTTTPKSSSSPSSIVPTSPDDGPSLDYKGIVGIAVGVIAAVGLSCFLAGYLIFKRRQARQVRKLSSKSDVSIIGPYEVLGSSKGPVEVNGKETQVHEMVSSRDTLAHESDSASVYEIGNTVKKPGLHEMPG